VSQEWSRSKKKPSGNRKEKSEKEITLGYAEMKDILQTICQQEDSENFSHPVKDRDAPGYSSIISHPMDLGTIKRNLKSNAYLGCDVEFVKDMRLIWSNCLLYNNSGSDIANRARKLSAIFEKELSNHTKKALTKEANNQTPGPPPQKELNSASMMEIIKKLKESNHSLPFIYPVDVKLAPGYTDIVKSPMSLSQVEHNVRHKLYDTPSAFIEDVNLIWQNCKLYNLPNSEIYASAEKCYALFQQLLLAFEVPIVKKGKKHQISESTEQLSNEDQAPRIKKLKKEQISEPAIESFDNDYLEKDKVNRGKLSWQERKFRSILRQLSSDQETSTLFATSEKDKDPTKISPFELRDELKNFIDSPVVFLGHMTKLLSDVQTRSGKGSGLEKTVAAAMSKLELSFQKAFPGVSASHEVVADKQFSNTSTEGGLVTPESIQEDLRRLFTLNLDLSFDSAPVDDGFCRTYIIKKAAELLRRTDLPFIVVPSLYQVEHFGNVDNRALFHTKTLLYPVGYSVRSTLRLCLEKHQAEVLAQPFVNVTIDSRIFTSADSEGPVFILFLENGTEICRGETPLEAWCGIKGLEEKVLFSLSNRLRRCRAVLNRMSVSPDAVPFLDQIPMEGSIGQDYYSVIKSPMWLTEVHSRLMDGIYDNEFDFAWDVRLIFRNCTEYNASGSALFLSAERLSKVFETLFAGWVLNVYDSSVKSPAEGQWNEWYYLKYFDTPDSENFCRATSTQAKSKELLKCKWCEDQYLPSALSLEFSKIPKSWICPRCQTTLTQCSGDLKNIPSIAQEFESFEGRNVYVPAPELGSGWCHAKRKAKTGPKNVYLSPLGYELYSKEDIQPQKEFEEEVDDGLMQARAKEFGSLVSGKKPAKRKDSRSRKSSSGSVSFTLDEDLENVFDVKHLEEGRILTGKLANLHLPQNFCFTWCVRDDSSRNTSKAKPEFSKLDFDSLPISGFFGLEVPEIQQRIEGLPDVNCCDQYQLLNFDKIKSDLILEIDRKREGLHQIQAAGDRVFKLLLDKRWSWEKHNNFDCFYDDASEFLSVESFGFKPLTVFGLSDSILDSAMFVWNFLGTAKNVFSDPQLSLQEFLSSLHQPHSILHTVSQVVFDELCSGMTDYLFRAVKEHVGLDEKEWIEIEAIYPVNVLTWPKVAELTLSVLSLPWTHDQFKLLLNAPIQGDFLLQLKVLALIFNHPCADLFVNIPEEAPFLSGLLDKIVNSNCDSNSGTEFTRDEFCNSIFQFFRSFEGTQRSPSSENFLSWIQGLLVRIGYLTAEEVAVPEEELPYQPAVRSWGGFTSKHLGSQKGDNILTPWSFDTSSVSLYQKKMKALFWLERSLSLLSCADPESWNIQDRLNIYLTLSDFSLGDDRMYENILNKMESNLKRYHQISQQDCGSLQNDQRLKLASAVPEGTRCVVTGISFSSIPNIGEWAVVPEDLVLENCSTDTGSGDTRYALKQVLEKVLKCKEISDLEKRSYEVSISSP
jgi:hypothetical protein